MKKNFSEGRGGKKWNSLEQTEIFPRTAWAMAETDLFSTVFAISCLLGL